MWNLPGRGLSRPRAWSPAESDSAPGAMWRLFRARLNRTTCVFNCSATSTRLPRRSQVRSRRRYPAGLRLHLGNPMFSTRTSDSQSLPAAVHQAGPPNGKGPRLEPEPTRAHAQLRAKSRHYKGTITPCELYEVTLCLGMAQRLCHQPARAILPSETANAFPWSSTRPSASTAWRFYPTVGELPANVDMGPPAT